MKTVMKYLIPKRKDILLVLSVKIFGSVIDLFLPWMLAVILNEYAPVKNWEMTFRWGGAMFLCVALSVVANVTANRMATAISRDVTFRLRGDLFRKVIALSCTQADQFTVPSLISRLTADTYNVHQMIDRSQRMGVRGPVMLIGGIIITLSIEPVLALVLLALFPIISIVVWKVSAGGTKIYGRTQKALDRLILRVQESMAGIRVIQALSKGEYEKDRFDKANTEVVQLERKATLLVNVTEPALRLLLHIAFTLVVVVGAFRVNAGVTGTGTVIAFLSYCTLIVLALMAVSRMFIMFSRGAASADRIEEVLLAEAESLKRDKHLQEPEYHISFDEISFSYDKIRNNVSNLSFRLKRGETLGIIGPTGSGKSTILQLLLRFYTPDQGQIRINGKCLSDYTPEDLYHRFGVVFQNDFLYADTIENNITLGRSLTPEAIQQAIRTARAEFVYEKEGGLEYEMASKASDFSGGQKQRLLLARAFADCPEILLLDDSSSALDYKTDYELREGLKNQYAGSTKIMVAQRIHSIKEADRIIVLEQSRVIGQGTHQELMDTCPYYYELAQIQMGEVANHA